MDSLSSLRFRDGRRERPPLWTSENRGRYNRGRLRGPTDLADEEGALVAPLIPPAKRGGNKRSIALREVVNGLMCVLGTGAMAGAARGPAATQYGARLFRPVGLRCDTEAPAPYAVRRLA